MRSGRQIVKMALIWGNCRGKERKMVAVRDIVQDFLKMEDRTACLHTSGNAVEEMVVSVM